MLSTLHLRLTHFLKMQVVGTMPAVAYAIGNTLKNSLLSKERKTSRNLLSAAYQLSLL